MGQPMHSSMTLFSVVRLVLCGVTGMAIGVLLSMISFVVVYAKLPALSSSSLLLRSSTVVRSYEERCALLSRANRGKIVTISLKGYVFFGSAVKILEEVKSRVILTPSSTNGPIPSDSHMRRENSSSAGHGDQPLPAPTPMFSFLMSHKEDQTEVRGEDAEMKDGGSLRDREREGQYERDTERGYRFGRMVYNPLDPMVSSSSVSSSSRHNGNGNGSVLGTYAPLASTSSKDSPLDGDQDSMLDEEEGSSPRYASSSSNRSRSKSKDNGNGPPYRSKSIPMLSPSNSVISSSSVGPSECQGQGQRERAGSLLVGSPLQFISAYDMDQDTLSSYQKRWTYERDQPGPHHSHSALTPSTSSQSLTRAPVGVAATSLSDRPPKIPQDPGTAIGMGIGMGMGSERSSHWIGAGPSVELPPYPTHVAAFGAGSGSGGPGPKVSALSSSLASFTGIQSERKEQQQHQQACQDILESTAAAAAVPVKATTRTKSMSHLLSSPSSLTSGSILSAVWSSQERRRERVKLLSSPRGVRLNATDAARDGDRDRERRSKSYDSLSAAVSYHIGDIGALDAIVETPVPPPAESNPTRKPPLHPLALPSHPHQVVHTDKGQGQGTEPTEFLILDFSEVLGIDATSARSCFLMLVR